LPAAANFDICGKKGRLVGESSIFGFLIFSKIMKKHINFLNGCPPENF